MTTGCRRELRSFRLTRFVLRNGTFQRLELAAEIEQSDLLRIHSASKLSLLHTIRRLFREAPTNSRLRNLLQTIGVGVAVLHDTDNWGVVRQAIDEYLVGVNRPNWVCEERTDELERIVTRCVEAYEDRWRRAQGWIPRRPRVDLS